MIIGVFGTNGSGKSTVMRAVMGQASGIAPQVDERQREVGYQCIFSGVHRDVRVVGRYTEGVGTGGCDTVKDVAAVYAQIAELHELGLHVLYEGIRMMNHMRSVDLQKRTRAVTAVLLTTTLDEALARIRARQEKVGRVREVNVKEIRGNIGRARACAAKVRAVGGRVVECSSDDAPREVLRLLREDGK